MNTSLKSGIGLAIIIFALTIPLISEAGCLDKSRLTGVNAAGAEFNSNILPGVPEKDYTYPTPGELAYVSAQGGNIIRLPFRWERLQPTIPGPFNEAELTRIRVVVDMAKAQDMCVILDVHNYAKYFGQSLADDKKLQDAFVDLWKNLAIAFPDASSAAFGLMNEPKYMPIPEWAQLAKRTLAEIRRTKSTNLVLVAGGNWSGVHDWFTERDGLSNANAFQDLTDPIKHTFIELHQYADSNFSGASTSCLPPEEFGNRFGRVASWAREHKQLLFLGEFGTPSTPDCLATLERFLTLLQANEWQGWTYWAIGRWWGSYPLALNTNADVPSPQWALLKKYFYSSDKNLYKAIPPKPPKPLAKYRFLCC